MSIFITVWAWFAGTKLGRFVIVLLALAAAFISTWYIARSKGKHAQAVLDAARDARAEVDAAKVAKETYAEASEAVAKVQEQAKAQPPPDSVKRGDFDNTF